MFKPVEKGPTMPRPHTEKCKGANRFGDGFECICGADKEEPTAPTNADLFVLQKAVPEHDIGCSEDGCHACVAERSRAAALAKLIDRWRYLESLHKART
jgi:hypothetical protein